MVLVFFNAGVEAGITHSDYQLQSTRVPHAGRDQFQMLGIQSNQGFSSRLPTPS